MAEEQYRRVRALFDQAVELPPAERDAFLTMACGDDLGLRAEVESLLAYDAGPSAADAVGFLKSPLVRAAEGPFRETAVPWSGAEPGLPGHIGHYRILRRLGEGGMGAVYEAEQDNPRRRVALKVIRPDLVAPPLLKRFAKEAQILGRLHHPGIASVYEAGLAEGGRPFFALELIDGLPLDAYARLHSLTAAARLELLVWVCDAVQHAHEHGVIHRDLKPGNILVDEAGQPKVLDFGVAHATDADLQTTTGRTESGQLLGTLSYMSPEQVAGDPAALDQRSDVYTLGVILFELLAGRLPYDLEHLPLLEVAQVIREREPSRLGSLDARFRGDVETIVGKALAKDKARRYASVRELALDIRRHLGNEPIRARPPSALYQLRKFARRHTALVGGVAATVMALVLGLVGTILFAVGEARQRAEAEHNAREAEHSAREANHEKHEARFQTYRACIAAAVAALSAHDVADAARHLDAAPEDLRGWEWQYLHSRLDDSSAVIPLPAEGVSFLLGAPDRLRAVVTRSGDMRVTDLESGESKTLPIGRQRGHDVTVAQTHRGLRVAVWVGDTTLDLLDEAGRSLCRAKTPSGAQFGQVAVSPDGTRLTCNWLVGARVRLAVFDASSGKQTASCDGHGRDIWSAAFSPDGTRLATGGGDNLARLWDPATGALLATCRGHWSKVLRVAFRPDGARLVTASSDGTVRQWNAATGQEVEPPYDRHSGEVADAVYSPDGDRIASAGTDRTIRVWQAKGRQDVAVLHGHTGVVLRLAFAADGRRLASASNGTPFGWRKDDTVRLWDVDPQATLPVLRGHTENVYPVAFSCDGRWIASGGWDKMARLWDAATGEPCATLRHPGYVLSLAFSPDGRRLVTGSYENDRLRIWDVATAHVRKEVRIRGHLFRFFTVSPDGRRVAAKTDHAPLRVYDVTTGEQLFSADGKPLAYSADGRWLAIVRAADDKTVVLLDARTHETVARFQGHEKAVLSATFSPDSRRLASCSQDRTVRLWEINGGACQVLHGHTDAVFAAAFYPDGRRLATAGRDGAIWLWDLQRGEEVARLPGHTSFIWSLAFSPDGATLASGSGDSTVRLWDTKPLKKRYEARREAQALRPEAERLVARLFREKPDAAAVVAALRSDGALTEPQRHAAVRAVLRREQVALGLAVSMARGGVLRLLGWGVAVPWAYWPEM
jgi:WD40 repeat protein